jgi:predicted HNH restriction endonuclease
MKGSPVRIRASAWLEKYMYFFDPVVEINAPKDAVMSALGYNPDDPVQRFYIPSADRQENLVAEYGDLDGFLRSISRSSSLLRLGVAVRTRDDAAVDEEMDAVASEYSAREAEETIEELVKAAPPPERKVVRSVLKRKLKPRLQLKKLYADACQVCGYRIEKKNGGFYSEAAHLVRLSVGLANLDVVQNMVVLCPNHHKMLDHGKMRIEWDHFRGLVARGLGAPDIEMTNKHIGGHANGSFLPK